MKCIYCQFDETRVVDSRESGNETRRRRECEKCENRFTTYERADLVLMVIKKDGRREPFSRDKILKGLNLACEKRPITQEQIEATIDEIEIMLRSKGRDVKSVQIGELVMKKLKKLDHIAYLRFASVYRSFADVTSFEKELKLLKK